VTGSGDCVDNRYDGETAYPAGDILVHGIGADLLEKGHCRNPISASSHSHRGSLVFEKTSIVSENWEGRSWLVRVCDLLQIQRSWSLISYSVHGAAGKKMGGGDNTRTYSSFWRLGGASVVRRPHFARTPSKHALADPSWL
jgi:hypothetical protein